MLGHFFFHSSRVLVTFSCALISIAGMFVCLSREVTSFISKNIKYTRENMLESFCGVYGLISMINYLCDTKDILKR